jgi:8-oxo-dGTP pyrophosphatase MutT (NUDIX family)
VLLISSRKKRRWVIPKGVKEPDLTPQASAAKEALEEAGIEGRVSERPIGTYRYQKWGGICTVEVFAMAVGEVRETWEESYRDREWLSLETAISRIDEDRLKELLRSLPDFLRAQA